MNCRNTAIKDLLPLYVEDALNEGENRETENHLAVCPDCRSELALLQELADDPVPDPGPDFWAGLPPTVERQVGAVRPQKITKRFEFNRPGRWLLLPGWTWATAAVAAILVVAWFAINPGSRADGPALQEIYDVAYASVRDPVLTHPSTYFSDLSDSQVATISTWADEEFSGMAQEAEAAVPVASYRDEEEELADLNGAQIEKLSTILKDYSEEG